LSAWAATNGVRQPVVPAYCEQAWHMYYLILPSLAKRQALITHLKASGIQAVFHYLPLHLSEYGCRWGSKTGDCPVTEDLSDRLLRLPFHNVLSDEDQTRVIETLQQFTCSP